jgi:hypothetical protein
VLSCVVGAVVRLAHRLAPVCSSIPTHLFKQSVPLLPHTYNHTAVFSSLILSVPLPFLSIYRAPISTIILPFLSPSPSSSTRFRFSSFSILHQSFLTRVNPNTIKQGTHLVHRPSLIAGSILRACTCSTRHRLPRHTRGSQCQITNNLLWRACIVSSAMGKGTSARRHKVVRGLRAGITLCLHALIRVNNIGATWVLPQVSTFHKAAWQGVIRMLGIRLQAQFPW